MTKIKHYLKVFSIAFCVLALVGCGASSSSSSSSSSDSDAVDISGSTTVSGVVTVSNAALTQAQAGNVGERLTVLSGMALQEKVAQVKQRLQSFSSTISSADDEVNMGGGRVYVSLVQEDGSIVTTSIYAEINSEGEYEFSIDNGNGLADGNTYVFKAINYYEDGDGNINKVVSERIDRIDEGTTTKESPIQPGMEVIMKTVIDKLTSVDIDEETLTLVIGVIADTISELIENGDIVVETQVTQVASASEAEADGLTASNYFTESDEDVNNVDVTMSNEEKEAKSRAEADDDVASIFKEAELKEKRDKDPSEMSQEELEDLIRDMFGVADGSNGSSGGKSGGDSDGGVPDFYIFQFANAYRSDVHVDIETFATAWRAGMPSESRSLSVLSAEIVTSMNSVLTAIYEAYDAQTTTTSATKIMADDFFEGDQDAALKVTIAFADDDRFTLPVTDSTEFDVLQSILMFGITGFMDDTDGGDHDDEDGDDEGEGDDDNFDPIAFTTTMGLVSLDDNTVYITEARVRPVRMWVPTNFTDHSSNWEQTDALDIEVSLLSNGVAESDIASVQLSYTDTDGNSETVTLEIDDHDDEEDPSEKAAILGRISTQGSAQYNKVVLQETSSAFEVRYRLSPWDFHDGGDGTSIVSDFEAGSAQIIVKNTSGGTLASETITIRKFTVDSPAWVFPTGPNMDTVRKYGWDNTFEPMFIPTEEGESSVSPRLEWEEYDGTLADGFSVAYAVNVGLQVFRKDHDTSLGDTTDLIPSDVLTDEGINASNENDDYWDWSDDYGKWKHIWSTWEDNKIVYDNFVILPSDVELEETLSNTDSGKNYDATYEISVRPLVVDDRGLIVWEGDESRTNFRVGTPPSYTYDLSGTITFPDTFATHDHMSHIASEAGEWKIGLFFNRQKNESGRVRNVFWDEDNGDARTPLSVSDTPIVGSLGTFSDITSDPERDFTLPTFLSTDGLIERHEEVNLVVWYDVENAPSGDGRWESDPEDDKIDVYDDPVYGANFLEQTEMVHNMQIRYEEGTLVLDTWDNETGHGDRQFLEVTENRVIDAEVYQWFDEDDDSSDD